MDTGAPRSRTDSRIAIVSLTRGGTELGEELGLKLPGSDRFIPRRLGDAPQTEDATRFERLADIVGSLFRGYPAIVFIMAAGIVVRHIAPLLGHKASDPAVVVLDERGRFAVSLLSGHAGGANRLAETVADLVGGQAVVTTASDVEGKPAIDVIASDLGMELDNPGALARVARAIIEDEPLWIHDPEGSVAGRLESCPAVRRVSECQGDTCFSGSPPTFGPPAGPADASRPAESPGGFPDGPGIVVSERIFTAGDPTLVLRPRRLVVGIGCNRGTGLSEVLGLLVETFRAERLSLLSIRNLASVDVKRDEPAILGAARALGRPVHFYSRPDLEGIAVPNPSAMVKKHLGVESVCEAAALLDARTNRLLIPKRKTRNVTLAVARANSPS